ncbi:MAG: hypothetical protein VXX32_00590 [Bacteroidota bacterium]|nr:hypothetical protein [Bacteroidota bacterium]
MTHAHINRLRMIAASLFLACCASATWGQTTPATTEEKPEVDLLLKEKWRHVGFHLISDVPGDNLESVLDEPSYGFALTYMKHDRKGIFDGGLDLGFQPIGGFDTTVVDANGGTVGQLYVRNQLAHAHYLLRMTLFQNSGFQPFAEGYAGVRGSFLGARLVLDGEDDRQPVNDVPFFSANFNYGYAAGLRLRLGKRSFITARYAQMFHLEDGNVVQVADPNAIVIGEDGSVSSSATTNVTLPPHSVRVGLAINL